MSERASASQRCPQCRRSFRALEDEHGMHECPWCGYEPTRKEEEAMDDGPPAGEDY